MKEQSSYMTDGIFHKSMGNRRYSNAKSDDIHWNTIVSKLTLMLNRVVPPLYNYSFFNSKTII